MSNTIYVVQNQINCKFVGISLTRDVASLRNANHFYSRREAEAEARWMNACRKDGRKPFAVRAVKLTLRAW